MACPTSALVQVFDIMRRFDADGARPELLNRGQIAPGDAELDELIDAGRDNCARLVVTVLKRVQACYSLRVGGTRNHTVDRIGRNNCDRSGPHQYRDHFFHPVNYTAN